MCGFSWVFSIREHIKKEADLAILISLAINQTTSIKLAARIKNWRSRRLRLVPSSVARSTRASLDRRFISVSSFAFTDRICAVLVHASGY